MARQKTYQEMNDLEKANVTEQRNAFVRDHDALQTGGRGGIMRWRDSMNTTREPLLHQVVAVNKLLNQDTTYARTVTANNEVKHESGSEKPFHKRKASQLAVHAVGTGKTIVGVLALAGVNRLARLAGKEPNAPRPDQRPYKTMIIVPKSVLKFWEKTVLAWTSLTDEHVLTIDDQQWFYEPASVNRNFKRFEDALVVITTPDVIKAALMTCYEQTSPTANDGDPLMPHLELKGRNGGKIYLHPLLCLLERDADEKYDLGVEQSPWALTIVDEAHLYANPCTWLACGISLFTGQSVFKLGLTGTPIKKGAEDISHLAMLLDVRMHEQAKDRMMEMQQPGYFAEKGVKNTLNVEHLNQFRERFMDRVGTEHLPEPLPAKKEVLFYYDPFIGLNDETGEIDAGAISEHNGVINESTRSQRLQRSQRSQRSSTPLLAEEPEEATGEDGGENFPEAPEGSKWKKGQRGSFRAISMLGNFEFSVELGRRGAAAFNRDPALYSKACKNPSQAVLLIERVIRDRQKNGHARIAVFAESVVQLKILQLHLEDKGVGELFLFDGILNQMKRGEQTITDFLKCDQGVILLSKAGGIGINLQDGCEVMLSVGSLPWNHVDIDQAFGRIYRYRQKKRVEFVQFIARRSVTAAKYKLHRDKRDRLERAAVDDDYTSFSSEKAAWRWSSSALRSVAPLDPHTGNYTVLPEHMKDVHEYQTVHLPAYTNAKQAYEAAVNAGSPSTVRPHEPKEPLDVSIIGTPVLPSVVALPAAWPASS